MRYIIHFLIYCDCHKSYQSLSYIHFLNNACFLYENTKNTIDKTRPTIDTKIDATFLKSSLYEYASASKKKPNDIKPNVLKFLLFFNKSIDK